MWRSLTGSLQRRLHLSEAYVSVSVMSCLGRSTALYKCQVYSREFCLYSQFILCCFFVSNRVFWYDCRWSSSIRAILPQIHPGLKREVLSDTTDSYKASIIYVAFLFILVCSLLHHTPRGWRSSFHLRSSGQVGWITAMCKKLHTCYGDQSLYNTLLPTMLRPLHPASIFYLKYILHSGEAVDCHLNSRWICTKEAIVILFSLLDAPNT